MKKQTRNADGWGRQLVDALKSGAELTKESVVELATHPVSTAVATTIALGTMVGCGKEDIEPVNQPPKITAVTPVQGLKENVPAGTVVARFTASDADGRIISAHITEGGDKFDVDPIEKTIFIKEGFRPDYETKPTETFKLRVFDDKDAGSQEAEGSVSFEDVYEADINYTGPKTFSVKENNEADTTIIENVFQYYNGGQASPSGRVIATVDEVNVTGSSLIDVDDRGNVKVVESIDYEALTEDQKEKGIMFEIVFEEDGQETGRISGLKYIPENIGPDGLMENMEVKGAYHLEGLHEDIIGTADQQYNDGEEVGDPVNFESSTRYEAGMSAYLTASPQLVLRSLEAANKLVSQHENFELVVLSAENGRYAVKNKQGTVIPIFSEEEFGGSEGDTLSIVAKHSRLFINFLRTKGFVPRNAFDVIAGAFPEQALLMKVYVAFLANRPKTEEAARLAAQNTIEVLQDENLLNPSEKVQKIIDALNAE